MIAQAEALKKIETDYLNAISILERNVLNALKTYSNVERGSGHFSQVSTALFEYARKIILEHWNIKGNDYISIFCTPRWAELLKKELTSEQYFMLSSHDIGLPVGVRVLAVKKNVLPKGIPVQTGGGMVKLVSPKTLVMADIPQRFEAGTPAIINVIAYASALQLISNLGTNPFQNDDDQLESNSVNSILYQDHFFEYKGSDLLQQLRKSMIGKDTMVPVDGGEQFYTNLDNAASTPAFLPVWNTVCQSWRQPHYIRWKIISEVKEICAEFFTAPATDYEIIFCSNTTEAINIAVRNFEYAEKSDIRPVVLNTILEHHSNELPWRFSPKSKLIRLSADSEGFLNINELEQLLKEYNQLHFHGLQRIRIVAVSGASNVLGTFNDIRAITRIVHKYNAQIIVDGAQLAAHRKISMLEDEIDYLAVSGHKMYAPFGSGALIARKEQLNFNLNELSDIKASGEENAAGIAALGKAIALLQRIGMNVIREDECRLTKRLLQGLSEIDGVKVFGVQNAGSKRFGNKGAIVAFKVKGVPHNLVAKELAEMGGIGVRTGCFCAHPLVKKLMGITPFRGQLARFFLELFPRLKTTTLPGIVRVSIGLENDEHDVDHFIKTLKEIATKRRTFINKAIELMYNGTMFLPRTSATQSIEKFVLARLKKVYSGK
jgi:selenocysteine lyase/cysteine desulfurase